MNTLVIIRHGEQCSKEGLTHKGHIQARNLARALEGDDIIPDIILTSNTGRSKKTSLELMSVFKGVASVDMGMLCTNSLIYNDLLSNVSSKHQTVFLSGHAENIDVFPNQVLDEQACIELLNALPAGRRSEYSHDDYDAFSVLVKHADALVLSSETEGVKYFNELKWKFKCYYSDGIASFFNENDLNLEAGNKSFSNRPFYQLQYTRLSP